jgi:hypothetical protein
MVISSLAAFVIVVMDSNTQVPNNSEKLFCASRKEQQINNSKI